ncbi:MAG: Uma2 family endonuclease [Polyangiales bacterium]
MSAAAKSRSFEELYREIEQLPEGQRGEILVAGELLVTMGRPGRPHRKAAQQLYDSLRGSDCERGGSGWWIEIEPEVRFGDRLFDPDLAGWRVDRVPELPRENPISLVPDWCCEVLSPKTAVTDIRVKLPHYVASGVPFVWIVDPEMRLVQVYAAENGPRLVATASDDTSIRLPPFDLDIDPRRFWLASA